MRHTHVCLQRWWCCCCVQPHRICFLNERLSTACAPCASGYSAGRLAVDASCLSCVAQLHTASRGVTPPRLSAYRTTVCTLLSAHVKGTRERQQQLQLTIFGFLVAAVLVGPRIGVCVVLLFCRPFNSLHGPLSSAAESHGG